MITDSWFWGINTALVWTLGDWLYNLETSLPLCIFRAANHNTALNHVHQFKLAGKTISHCKTWTWPASKDVIGYGNNYFYIYQETSYSHRMCLVLNMQYVFDLKSFTEAVTFLPCFSIVGFSPFIVPWGILRAHSSTYRRAGRAGREIDWTWARCEISDSREN